MIPLSTDKEKQSQYLSAMGNVRIGKILEDLDHMAVHVAYVHNSENGSLDGPMTLPRTIVTASVKRIDFHKCVRKCFERERSHQINWNIFQKSVFAVIAVSCIRLFVKSFKNSL